MLDRKRQKRIINSIYPISEFPHKKKSSRNERDELTDWRVVAIVVPHH
jgi:hypothetical protein